ncbi:peptidase C15 [Roseibium salinum]|uniref:Pyrrolidone-carboxylate peptidase n=1 Tax=Roseibium salinum TaxID=1604349 RepID=A0ABT3QZD0_9HYPH|nr:peptidase C15 [Roseibium sp. DSM 29163]MCX2722198.1 peptidase C15 [Roseibium sp. DSM 29163]
MRRVRTILVTGFSPFPGAPVNPTERLMHRLPRRLGKHQCGVEFVFHVLPTTWAGRRDVTDRLRLDIRPDAIVHFGVDGTRRTLNIETRAINRAVRVRPDAMGRAPERPELAPSGERIRRSTLPGRALCRAALAARAPAALSDNAGTYLCNATLWDSIGSGIPSIFVHVPALPRGPRDSRPPYHLVEDAAVRLLQETARRLP